MAQLIDMPKLSDTMTVGTLVKWLKKEGDVIKAGDMLAEVETDKATMELESFFAGINFKPFNLAITAVGFLHSSIHHLLRGTPDIWTGSISFDEGNNWVFWNIQFSIPNSDRLTLGWSFEL